MDESVKGTSNHDTTDEPAVESECVSATTQTGSDSTHLFPAYDESSAKGLADHKDPLPEHVGPHTHETPPSEVVREKFSRQVSEMSHSPTVLHLHRFTLYETNARFFVVGADITDRYFKVLKIDRTSALESLSIFEDGNIYTKQDLNSLLATIDDGNQATGGLRVKFNNFWGLLGFISFTESYYMLLITKRHQVAMLGGHYIYQVDATELIPMSVAGATRSRERNADEARYLSILNNLDLSKHFYFSYSYDITTSLQDNIIKERKATSQDSHTRADVGRSPNDTFIWNNHLFQPAVSSLTNMYDWCIPIIHGFIDQSSINVFGRLIYITVIGRRSRYFAGARFLKRGINDMGYVANDVETEQIVSELLTTSFHAPGPRLYSNPTYTSYLHHRGSIPLHWTQDSSGVTPKPDIDLCTPDPFYQHAAMHFDDLFDRYGCPVYVLNLIKARERTPRESKLLYEFQHAIDYLNQFLPTDKRIVYQAFDMSRAAKTHGGDVIGTLEGIAQTIMDKTGFFHNGDSLENIPGVQNGIARTNCIDCLDRTNAAQFVIGKRAFGYQLKALGVIPSPDMEYDSDAINIFTHMFHDHGDTIAVQYGGSHLVNTMATYRKINHWQSQSRDMVESFKRYYHNSFLDAQRQEAYNLFLGNYVWAAGQPMLWDLTSDYYLHHAHPRTWLAKSRSRKSYKTWFTDAHLATRTLPASPDSRNLRACRYGITDYDDYWLEYYRPSVMSSFMKNYAFRLSSDNRFLPERPSKPGYYNFSPFVRRQEHAPKSTTETSESRPKKGVTIIAPTEAESRVPGERDDKPSAIWRDRQAYLSPGGDELTSATTTVFGSSPDARHDLLTSTTGSGSGLEKSQLARMTMNQILNSSLNPTVTLSEQAEYEHYVSHPHNLPLVLNTDPFSTTRTSDATSASAGPGPASATTTLSSAGAGAGGGGGGGHGGPSGLATTTLDFIDYIDSGTGEWKGEGNAPWDVTEVDIADFKDFVALATLEDALTVFQEDLVFGTAGAGGAGVGAGGMSSFEIVPSAPTRAHAPGFPPGRAGAGDWDVGNMGLDTVGDGNEYAYAYRRSGARRYKAYRQWLVKGKSLFKLSKVDPEYQVLM